MHVVLHEVILPQMIETQSLSHGTVIIEWC